MLKCQELDAHTHNRYGFSISVQPEIGCTSFHSFFSWNVWKKKSWQVRDWWAELIIMLGFKDLKWPKVFRRSNVGLVGYYWADDSKFKRLRTVTHWRITYVAGSVSYLIDILRETHRLVPLLLCYVQIHLEIFATFSALSVVLYKTFCNAAMPHLSQQMQ